MNPLRPPALVVTKQQNLIDEMQITRKKFIAESDAIASTPTLAQRVASDERILYGAAALAALAAAFVVTRLVFHRRT